VVRFNEKLTQHQPITNLVSRILGPKPRLQPLFGLALFTKSHLSGSFAIVLVNFVLALLQSLQSPTMPGHGPGIKNPVSPLL
jgi:hypothetical protein